MSIPPIPWAADEGDIAARDRALARHEGGDVAVTALAHLGHTLTYTRPWRHDNLPTGDTHG